MEYRLEGSPSTTITPTSTSDIIAQHNKLEALLSEQLSYNNCTDALNEHLRCYISTEKAHS